MSGNENNKRIPAFVIDDSALQDMFEGKNKGQSNELLIKLKQMKDSGRDVVVTTTLSAFLRAIFLSDSEVKIGKIQKVLSFIRVAPSFADFTNAEAVRKEIVNLAHIMSGGKVKGP